MAVFPENMERLDLKDTTGSLSKIQDYIRYMTERVEFSMRNMTKTVSAAGFSSAEIHIQMQEQARALAATQSVVNALSGDVGALQNAVNNLAERVTDLESTLTPYEGDYEVTPRVVSQTLETANKLMTEDVNIRSIPYYEVSNEHQGQTVIIGDNNDETEVN